jgi:hypothetical protein
MNLLETFQPGKPTVHELSTYRVHGLLMIEDDGVVAALAHVDLSGAVYPFQSVFHPVESTGSGHPHHEALIRGALSAWRELSRRAPGHFNRMILCTPASTARSRQATSRIRIEVQPGTGTILPKVDREHLRKLDDRLCTQNTSDAYVVVDMATHSYADDSGHERPMPEGTVTSTLDARSHLVMSPADLVTGIINAFRPLGVKFDVLMSAFAAAGGHLSPAEEDGTVVVDIDRDACWCSWYGWGRLLNTTSIPGGSQAIRNGCADVLGMPAAEFENWVVSHHDLFRHGSPATSLTSAPPCERLASGTLKTIYDATTQVCARLGRELRQSTQSAPGCLAPARRIIVMGDDPFAVQSFTTAISAYRTFTVEARFASDAHGLEHIQSPRIGRMVGAFRRGGRADAPRQPYLETCYPPPAERLRRQVSSVTLAGRTGRRLFPAGAIGQSFSRVVSRLQSLLF